LKQLRCAIIAALTYLALAVTANAQIGFSSTINYPVGTNPSGVAIGNVAGSALADLVVTTDNPDAVKVLVNLGSGTFGTPVTVTMAGGSGPQSVVLIDVDGDLDLDAVVTRKNIDDVQILTNTAGVLTPGATTSVGGSLPRDIVSGDLDGNGSPDVVTSNRDSDDISVLLNTGGSYSSAVVYSVGARPRGIFLADFNGDQRLDIAVASQDDRRIDVLFNQGSGVFGSAITLSVGPDLRPDGVVAADFDRDGDVDIAVSTSGDALNLATVFLNTGSGSFAAAISYAVGGTDPGGMAAADLDIDGYPDLATANQGSANVSTLRNLGAAAFETASLFTVGTTPEVVAPGDLDGNGSADLVAVNRDSGNVTVLLNQATALVFSDGFESSDTSAWSSVTP